MPRIANTQTGFATPTIPQPEQETPTLGQTFESAFALENDVLAAVDLLTKPAFKADPEFAPKLGSELRKFDSENKTSFFDNYRDNFVGVQSREEMIWLAQKIQQEQADRDVLARSGFAGFAAATAAGILSPTSFIPLVGPGLKAKTAWQIMRQAAMSGAAVGVFQEGLLQADQVTRGWEESAIGIGANTILGGLLGGAAAVVTKGERAALERSLNDSDLVITPFAPGSLSADVTSEFAESAGRLASGARTAVKLQDSNPLSRSPVTSTIQQPMRMTSKGPVPIDYLQSDVARGAMTQLADGGYRLDGNAKGVPTAPGGTVENRIQTYYNKYPDVVRTLDDEFLDYRFDAQPPKMFPGFRANLADLANATNGKLTKSEFKAEITKALRNNDTHDIPQVEKTAKYIRTNLLDPILAEAQKAGILPTEIDLKGDSSWIFRDYDRRAISRNPVKFIDSLAAHFEQSLREEFAEAATSMKLRRERSQELIDDLGRSPEEAQSLIEQFKAQLDELEEVANEEHLTALQDTVAELRARARELRQVPGLAAEKERKQFLADAREMEAAAGEPLAQLKQKRAGLRRRLSNLNRSVVALEEKQAAKLERVERVEELSMNSLHRAARAGQRTLAQLDRWSDKKLFDEVERLKNQFTRLAEQFDRGEERLAKFADTDQDMYKLVKLDAGQELQATRMTDTAERLAQAEARVNSREDARDFIEAMLDETLQKINSINGRRAVRAQRLMQQAEKLSPENALRRIDEVRAKQASREVDFLERWRVLGADSADIETGVADFREHARQIATEAKNNIMGTFVRLPSVDQLRGPRGSQIARTLNIPSNKVEEFLNNDIEDLMRQTLHTFPADIEIARRPEFGDVNGEQMFIRLAEEMDERLRQVSESDLAPKTKEKRLDEINQTYAGYRRNLEAVIGRLRHTWGLPHDPEGLGWRMGKTALNANVLRFMGGVVISSIPDIARPIMRYGLTRTLRDGFIPLVTNLKEMRLTMQEVKQLAGGLDVTMQSRAASVFDLIDGVGRGTKLEQGIEFATRRMGMLALFDYWTSGMKQFSGAVAHGKFMDSIEAVMTGKGNVGKATTFLAENGIDENLAERIWAQMQKNDGASRVNGRWLPNTSQWDDPEVYRAYSAAIIRETENTIITPGVDKPLWLDQSMMGRLLGQFKSFAFASTSRTLISGMQQRDAAVINGVIFSLAMGTLGYYLYAMAAGGKVKQEMLNAGPDKWADEAIARSGLLGILGEVQRIAERIPLTQPYATFSGTRSARRSGDNLTEAFLGPTFDLLSTGTNVAAGIHAPDDSTVHDMRTLLPGQNLFYLRQLFDQIEAATPKSEN